MGVKTGHVTCPITPGGGTLDLPLLRPTALWIEKNSRVDSDSRREG